MRYPKIKIKTTFWQGKNVEQWKEQYNRLLWYLGIFAITNIVYHMFSGTENKFIYIVNLIPFITTIIGTISYNKRKRKEND